MLAQVPGDVHAVDMHHDDLSECVHCGRKMKCCNCKEHAEC